MRSRITLRRLATATALCIALILPLVACDSGGTGSGERIRLAITPVPTPTTTPLPLPTVGATQYTVQSGDTLSSIAAQFGVTVDAIVRANNIADPNALSEGQVLTIPAREVEVPPTTLPVSTSGVPVIGATPPITATLSPGPPATETLPPPDATPPQGPVIPEPTP